jgi:hypothetical protein
MRRTLLEVQYMKREQAGSTSTSKRESSERESTGVQITREARGHARVAAQLKARVSTLDPSAESGDGPSYYLLVGAVTLDVADGGLGLAAEESMKRGQRVLVELELASGESVECKGRVAWSGQDTEGRSVLGISFEQELAGLASQARSQP